MASLPADHPLALALESGNPSDLQTALSNMPEDVVPAVNELLQKACFAKNTAVVGYLLNENPDVFPSAGPQNHDHFAAFSGGIEIYSMFLERWPEIKTSSFGYYGGPVYMAANWNNKEMLVWLLERRYDPDASYFINKAMLDVADEDDWPDRIVEILKRYGASKTGVEVY